ncbi:unnamed protein product [Heligmosomoides polygyrus]|uniref:CCHC-type domain-containing protein n=1 Tax=Heligmosomoides polygyrus TaxID=6339 RepID=A0A183F588_HELPZ|nr:unnamed protein product [Heligmosomoides polygyrus]
MGTAVEETLQKYKDLSSSLVSGSSSSEERDQALLHRMQQARQELETRTSHLSTALDGFTNAVDDMPEPIAPDQQVKVEQHIAAAQNLLEKAQDRLIELSLQLDQISVKGVINTEQKEVSSPNLAPMPIPKFRGQLRDWDHFWGIFDAVIHQRRISKIEELTYLMEALSGPAKDVVKDLQITADSYDVAIELLRRKYDNQVAVVGQLLQQMQDVQPKSNRLSDQNQAFYRIFSLVSQLDQKGENTKTEHMRRTILMKFADKIQRSMLKKKSAMLAEEWTTERLLLELRELFDMENQIEHLRGTLEEVKKEPAGYQPTARKPKLARTENTTVRAEIATRFPCFYCKKDDHSPRFCQEFPTVEQRSDLIRQRNLCRNCGSGDHRVKECPRGACQQCNEKGHHTSICRQSSKPQSQQPRQAKNVHQRAAPETHASSRRTVNQNFAAMVPQPSSTSCRIANNVILRTPEPTKLSERPVELLVGQARVWNNRTREFEDVHMILDAGADQSFITSEYAQHLGLERLGQR